MSALDDFEISGETPTSPEVTKQRTPSQSSNKPNDGFETQTKGQQDCEEPTIVGRPGMRYDYVTKHHNEDNNFDGDLKELVGEQCEPWYYFNMKAGNFWAEQNIRADGNIQATGEVSSSGGAHVLSMKKNLPFDMVHPTKPGWRLRHVCLEGPEIGVYLHGKNKGKVIELPDYWRGLVREETISVHLTPIGHPYVLFIEKIEDNKVYVETNWETSGVEIEYNYVIHASRVDDDLIVEYEGESHLDYPGGNEGYSFNYEHNYVHNLIKETIREEMRKN